MLRRIKDKRGFTLTSVVILLLVIVFVVVIALPLGMEKIDDVKTIVDDVNLSTASKMAKMHCVQSEESIDGYYYDIENSVFTAKKPDSYAVGFEAKGKVIQVRVSDTDEVTVSWVD